MVSSTTNNNNNNKYDWLHHVFNTRQILVKNKNYNNNNKTNELIPSCVIISAVEISHAYIINSTSSIQSPFRHRSANSVLKI